MKGYWTPDPRVLARERQRYLRQHYSGGQGSAHGHLLDPNQDVKTASWISTELAPVLDGLQEQGYDISDMASVTEVLESMGEHDMAQFIREQQHVEWQQFVEESMSAEAELVNEGPDIEKICRAARAAGLGIADTWESGAENTFEARIEFYAEQKQVRDFADAMSQRMPQLRFEVDSTAYDYPTLWVREQAEKQADTAAQVAEQAKQLLQAGDQQGANELLNEWSGIADYQGQSFKVRQTKLWDLGIEYRGTNWVLKDY